MFTSVSENIPPLYALPLHICFVYHLLTLQQHLGYFSLVTFRTTASCQLSLWIHPRSSKLLSVQKGSQMFRTLLSCGSSFQPLLFKIQFLSQNTISPQLPPPSPNPQPPTRSLKILLSILHSCCRIFLGYKGLYSKNPFVDYFS